MVSVFQSAMDAISVPSPLEPNVGQVEPAVAAEPAGAPAEPAAAPAEPAPAPPPGASAPTAAAEAARPGPPPPGGRDDGATVPVYLSPKSLTFAGVTTASGLIAGFVHNTSHMPVLEVSLWTGGIVGAALILLGFFSENRPKLTPYFILSSLIVGAVNATLLVITVYGAISVVQPTTT